MTDLSPLVVAVAPNGARYSKKDHPTLPITPDELAQTAVDCLQAGARMIHLHVRDENGRHSLSAEHYLPALNAVKEAVAAQMLIQVTSEAAGIYNTDQQIILMEELMPDFMSLALREFAPSGSAIKPFREFIHKLTAKGCLLQYILYDDADFKHYKQLIEMAIIPEKNHSLLFVLGRYVNSHPTIEIVDKYRDILSTATPMMVCTFGLNSHQILSEVVPLNCHVRVGFENGFYLPDASMAKTNAEIVEENCHLFSNLGRPIADIEQTRKLLGQAE